MVSPLKLGQSTISIGTALIKKSQHILSSNRGELCDVVVNPLFQKQGIASKLCQECFRYAKQIGCDYVLTSCRNNGTEWLTKRWGWRNAAGYREAFWSRGEIKRYSTN